MTGRLRSLDVLLLNTSRRSGGLFLFILTAHTHDVGVCESVMQP